MATKTGPARGLDATQIKRAQDELADREKRCGELAQRILSPSLSGPDKDTLASLADEHPNIGAYIKFLIVGTRGVADAPLDLLRLLQEVERSGMYGYLLAHEAVVEGEETDDEGVDERVAPARVLE